MLLTYVPNIFCQGVCRYCFGSALLLDVRCWLLDVGCSVLPQKPLLPQRLKQNQRHAIRQIQRPGIRIKHRNPQPVLPVLLQQLSRQPRRLPAEHDVIIRRKFGIRINLRSIRFHKPNPRRCRHPFRKHSPILPSMPFNVLPIIHSGTLQLRIVEFEPKRLDEMKRRTRRRAKPRHVPRVRGDFGFKQDDIHFDKA